MYFEIQADDPKRAMKFYSAIFGWMFAEVKGLPVPYWQIATDSDAGGLLQRPVKAPPPHCGTNAYVCSFEVKNFDETEKIVLQQGGVTAMAKFAVPGKCWQGYFLDPEGNTFGMFEVDETAGK